MTPASKILQTVSVPHTGNRFWWAAFNNARVLFGGSVLNRDMDIAPYFAYPHRAIVFVRHPVSVEISFRNRGEESRVHEFARLFDVANERTLFLRTDCPVGEREAELARLQSVVDAALSEQAAAGYVFKMPRHEIRTDWEVNPDHSVDGDWHVRRAEVLDDLRRTVDLSPFRDLGYEV